MWDGTPPPVPASGPSCTILQKTHASLPIARPPLETESWSSSSQWYTRSPSASDAGPEPAGGDPHLPRERQRARGEKGQDRRSIPPREDSPAPSEKQSEGRPDPVAINAFYSLLQTRLKERSREA